MLNCIRAATKDDLEQVYGLIRQLSRYEFTKEQFEPCYLHNLENNHVLVCEKDKTICGLGVLSIHYILNYSRKSAEIVELVVDEKHRSKGTGKILLAALEKIAIDGGCVRIDVSSSKKRESAHRFYEREGFASTHYKFSKELLA